MARKFQKRKINPTYLILVEGVTEKVYFDALKKYYRVSVMTIVIRKSNKPNPAHIIGEALDAINQPQGKKIFSRVWCVYDCDVLLSYDKTKFTKIYDDACSRGINFAETMPCIEVWFVMHFARPKTEYQNSKETLSDLRKYMPDYEKSQRWLANNLFAKLIAGQKTAFDNAREFELKDYFSRAAATSIHKLVKVFADNRGDV